MQMTTYEAKHKDATVKAITDIPNAELRRCIGKVYYKSETKDILDVLKKDIEKAQGDVVTLQKTKQYVD